MSVRCISQVLERSIHGGTNLLMLVVLADYSDDDGNSYPAVSSLARKCRTKPRNANYILKALADSGELRILKNEGPRGTNRYRIMLNALGQPAPLQRIAPLQSVAPLQPIARGGATHCAQPLQPIADEPSLNRQEPSLRGQGKPDRVPPCPHEELICLFGEFLPTLSQPRRELWIGKKQEDMRARWRWVLTATRGNTGDRYATTSDEALQWFGKYFKNVASSDFLTGRSGKWMADLAWLMNAGNFAKVVQGNYVNREAA